MNLSGVNYTNHVGYVHRSLLDSLRNNLYQDGWGFYYKNGLRENRVSVDIPLEFQEKVKNGSKLNVLLSKQTPSEISRDGLKLDITVSEHGSDSKEVSKISDEIFERNPPGPGVRRIRLDKLRKSDRHNLCL